MKYYRFYEEYTSDRRDTSAGTVVAVDVDTGPFVSADSGLCYEAAGGVFARPNSPVASTAVSVAYLRARCKRISEARARAIHPALFAYLGEPEPGREGAPA